MMNKLASHFLFLIVFHKKMSSTHRHLGEHNSHPFISASHTHQLFPQFKPSSLVHGANPSCLETKMAFLLSTLVDKGSNKEHLNAFMVCFSSGLNWTDGTYFYHYMTFVLLMLYSHVHHIAFFSLGIITQVLHFPINMCF